MSEKANMPSGHVDQNLLFGFLALQNNFISREELIAAVSGWLVDKSRRLDDILLSRRALAEDECQLIAAIVRKHLERNQDDVEQCLATISCVSTLRDDLEKLGDFAIQASLDHAVRRRGDSPSVDAGKTLPLEPATMSQGRFRILRHHAEGGLGQVFLAHDQELNREVALKEIKLQRADDPDCRSRFVVEAEITGGLEHPGIVPVYGFGQYPDGRPFYAMRFIRGKSLAEVIDEFHFSHAEADAYNSIDFRKLLTRFIDVCNAVEYAHSRGVLHRDLKPGNIMLGKFGETLVVDWGLAKAKGRDEHQKQSDERTLQPRSGSGSAATLMGSAVGTPAFMSPEQAAGQLDQLGPTTDVYSLGATLYYVLTGQTPFGKGNIGSILQQVQKGEFPRPRTIKPRIPVALEAICLWAMATSIKDRYPTPQMLADDVEKYLADEPVKAYSEPATTRTRRWLRKRPGTVAAFITACLVGITCGTVISVVVAGKNQQLAVANSGLIAANTAEVKARQRAEAVSDYVTQLFSLKRPAMERIVGAVTVTAEELLDHAVEDIEPRFRDDLETKAKILSALALSYEGLGLSSKANQLHENVAVLPATTTEPNVTLPMGPPKSKN